MLSYYRNALIQVKRNICRGVVSNSKPILLLSVLDNIQKGLVNDNAIYFDNALNERYKELYQSMIGSKISPACYPFFHINSDKFWHLKWKQAPVKVATVHAKFIRDNIEYAYLDNALWDLLQNPEICSDYRRTIEKFYFSK